MKKLLSILTVMVFAIGMMAQPTPQKQDGKRKGMKKANRGMKYMKDSLNISKDQETKLKVIFKDARKQRKTIKNSTVSKEEKKKQFKALSASTDLKVKSVLTSEQYAKLMAKKEAIKKKRKAAKKTPEGRAKGMTNKMKKSLNLTATQSPKVYEANLILVNKLKGLKAQKDQGKDKKELRKLGKEAHTEHYNSIKTILTADQLSKYDAQIAARKAKRKDKRAKKKAAK